MTSEVETLKKKTADAEALVLAAETAKKEILVTEALAAGKICNAQKDLLLKMSSAALAELHAGGPGDAGTPGSRRKRNWSTRKERQAVDGLEEEAIRKTR